MNTHLLDPKNIEMSSNIPIPDNGVVICDAKVAKLFADDFGKIKIPLLKLQAHESSKNLNNIEKTYEFLSKHNVQKRDVVHVFGGGVTMDMGAFAVSTFKRGCQLQLYPTTLIGMIDAGIGGKTGFNLGGIKNHIGSFYPAQKIILCPEFLSTLEEDHFRQGMAETIKLFLVEPKLSIKSPFDPKTYTPEGILTCAKSKMSICAMDPYDTGIRRKLNFGHSFAHALESLSKFVIKHGDAVVWGMTMATETAKNRGMISSEIYTKIYELLLQYPLPDAVRNFANSHPLPHFHKYLKQDKKNEGQIKLILPDGWRSVREESIPGF